MQHNIPSYDAASRLASTTNPYSETSSFSYDSANRMSHPNPREPPNRWAAYRIGGSLVVCPATELPAEADHLGSRRRGLTRRVGGDAAQLLPVSVVGSREVRHREPALDAVALNDVAARVVSEGAG